MALTGDHRYLNDKYSYFTKYTWMNYFQLFEKNTVLGKWLRSQNIIVRINDYLFLHAGISPQFALYDYAFSDINLRIQKFLNSDGRIEKGSPEDIILGPVGPQWYRGYGYSNGNYPEVTQGFIDSYLNSKGLKRMIVGHNEQSAITANYEGRVVSADVAIDEGGKSAQGLLISGDKIFRCLSDGTKERIE
jgi:hypothetical protein